MKKIFFVIFASIFLAWCTSIKIDNTKEIDEIEKINEITVDQVNMTNIDQVSEFAIQALRNKDMPTLSDLTSKEWIRFSPYSYVDTGRDIVIKQNEIKDIMDSKMVYVWGFQDWSGDPIMLQFGQYMDKYVYDADFVKLGERHINEDIMRWNTINNTTDIYTGKYIIEYYIPGQNTQYEWLDRKSLTLVFSQDENKERKLEAIIHNQWTI